MLQKPLSEITIDDLSELVANAVSESRNLEFKRELCGTTDSDKKEFLADVSAFANATGGDLIFGIDEVDGVASAIVGVQNNDLDSQILRLESLIRDGIEPRIPGVRCQLIPSGSLGPVLILSLIHI